MTLDVVLHEVADRVSYIRAETRVPDDGAWLACDALAAGGDAVHAAVDAGAQARGAGDRVVAASLFAQSYAFKVAAPALAAYAIGSPIPPVRPGELAVTLAKGRATGLAYRASLLMPNDDVAALAETLLAGHLAPFLDAVRGDVRIGQRLLWGNVAASCAAAFRAVEGAARDRGDHDERAAVRARADRFFAAADPWLEQPGRFEIVEHADHDGWYWTRTSCCLWFRVAAGGATCDDCSLLSADDLLAQRTAELAGTSS